VQCLHFLFTEQEEYTAVIGQEDKIDKEKKGKTT